MYVNNTDINFAEIGTTMFQVVDYFLENKKVPEDLNDIISITKCNNGNYIIDWA